MEVKDVVNNMLNESSKSKNRKAVKLYLEDLVPNKLNDIPIEDISELACSIKEKGLFEPITVYLDKNDKYVILSGHRRYMALNELVSQGMNELDEVDCFIVDQPINKANEVLELIARNSYRIKDKELIQKQVNQLSEIYDEMVEKPAGKKREWIASIIGKSGRTIQEYLNGAVDDRDDDNNDPEDKKAEDKKTLKDKIKVYKKLSATLAKEDLNDFFENCDKENAQELLGFVTDCKNIIQEIHMEVQSIVKKVKE